MPEKLDMKKEYKSYYGAKKDPGFLEIEEGKFIVVEGNGSPYGEEYPAKIGAVYPLAYGLKFTYKAQAKDFTVPPMSTRWWSETGEDFSTVPKEQWHWQIMVRVPDYVTDKDFEKVKQETISKKGDGLFNEVKLETFTEGTSAQILHIGPYSEEAPTIARLHEFIDKNGFEPTGHHHEIYLSDPRRTAPEKMKTIIRQPVKPKEKDD